MKFPVALCVTVLTLCDESIPVCQVFFYKGELHIIPLSEASEQDWDLSAPCPTIPEALALLSTRSEEFLAAEPIRAAVYKRIDGYVRALFGSSAMVGFGSVISGV